MASERATEALKYVAEAEADKQQHQIWHDDFYKYFMPWRRRPSQQSQQQPIHDQDELFDSTAIETLSDFAADMQATFTPNQKNWLNVEPSKQLPGLALVQLKAQMKGYEDSVFSEIRRSNFNEASQECYPDVGGGTMAVNIQDININEPFHCLAVPVTDLLVCRGVYGGVDFKARKLTPKYSELPALYPNAKFTNTTFGKIKAKDGTRAKVKECFWRDYSRPGIERHEFCLLLDEEEGDSATYEGRGSCPLIVTRWKTDSTTGWGIGPAYTILPEVKTLDQLKYLLLLELNKAVNPVTTYPDDGTINVENGVSPGDWIATGPDSEVKVIESQSKMDAGYFVVADMQANIKRALFQDKPDQKGKTPPTATQWLDENAQIDKRMGAPVGRLISEWQIPVFERFAYLMEKRGVLPKVEWRGEAIELRPQSPLVQSQRHEEVLKAGRILEMGNAYFGPEAMALEVDASKTLANIQERVGDDVVVLRTDAEKKALIETGAQVAEQTGMLNGAAA